LTETPVPGDEQDRGLSLRAKRSNLQMFFVDYSMQLINNMFFVFGARAAGICSMPHITALPGGNVGPAPSWRLFHKHRLLIAPPHLHILPQKPLTKDIDPLDFVNTLPETPNPIVNDASKQYIHFEFG